MLATEWNLYPSQPDVARSLASRVRVDPLIGQFLLNRGIRHPEDAKRFFSPRLETLGDPRQLPDMAQAVSRIRQAVSAREPIVVFGDSDVDGVTASAIVYETLTALGAQVQVSLSNRIRDGYGLPPVLAKRLMREQVKLLVLVDCGTNQPVEIGQLADRGIDTIVLDHHVPADKSASPLALVNPYRGTGYGREFCSAGLAFKLAQALWPDEMLLRQELDLTVLGTLADYAPMGGENRVLVVEGIQEILRSHRPGLQQICEELRVTKPTPEHILRRLVPCLNAAGRLGNPRPVWELLVERRPSAASRLVAVVKAAYAQAKALHHQIMNEAYEQVNRIHFKDQHVMVIGRPGWHPGFMGPLASQLMERYARPAIAIALDERVGVGSGRAPEMFNLFEALRACEGVLLRYGGHPQACGLTLKSGNLHSFREQINQHAKASFGSRRVMRTLRIDAEASLCDLTATVASTIGRFIPFGTGNLRPTILLRRLVAERDVSGTMWFTDDTGRRPLRGREAGLLSGYPYDVVVHVELVASDVALSVRDARVCILPAPQSEASRQAGVP